MDPKKFHDQLKQYGEVKYVSVPKSGNLREADEPDLIFRHGQEFEISKDDNPTLGLVLKKLHYEPKPCEDCGRLVENRVIQYKVLEFPEPHWRTSCKNCSKTQNPETGEFGLTSTQASNYFTQAIKDKKSVSTVKFRKPNK